MKDPRETRYSTLLLTSRLRKHGYKFIPPSSIDPIISIDNFR